MDGGTTHPDDWITGDDSPACVVHGKFHHLCQTLFGWGLDVAHAPVSEAGNGRR